MSYCQDGGHDVISRKALSLPRVTSLGRRMCYSTWSTVHSYLFFLESNESSHKNCCFRRNTETLGSETNLIKARTKG